VAEAWVMADEDIAQEVAHGRNTRVQRQVRKAELAGRSFRNPQFRFVPARPGATFAVHQGPSAIVGDNH